MYKSSGRSKQEHRMHENRSSCDEWLDADVWTSACVVSACSLQRIGNPLKLHNTLCPLLQELRCDRHSLLHHSIAEPSLNSALDRFTKTETRHMRRALLAAFNNSRASTQKLWALESTLI